MATLVEDSVDLQTPTGPMRVHLYRPAGEPGDARFPGLVLYSEIYQETPPIRRSALRFASEGFLVAVPEVFHEHEPPGAVLPYDKDGTDKGNRYKYDTSVASFDADAEAVLAHLAGHASCTGRLGAVGFCLGGHLAFRAAMNPRVLAAACFYATDIHTDTLGRGKTSDSLARAKDLRGEVMMVWGRQDPHVPAEGRAAIHARLSEAGVRFTWHEVNAVHAFMRDEGPRYDAALAALGYALALETFRRTL
ncbi:MAG TPA: dienelactone hydrolase family protein [Polyangiaceae bacterium]|jgi:carboxymethylenebutenolidase